MNIEGPLLLVPTHVVPEMNITVLNTDNSMQKQNTSDGTD